MIEKKLCFETPPFDFVPPRYIEVYRLSAVF